MWDRSCRRDRLGNHLLGVCRAAVTGVPVDVRRVGAIPAAASANRANAGSDFEPVFFMIEARWFSTVRWLMPRSAAMFLLGWPARTRSMIWRCRGVRPATWFAASSRQADSLLEIPRLFQSALDAGKQFVAADRLLDEVRSARLHRLNRHRHVAVAGDHDGRQTDGPPRGAAAAIPARSFRAGRHRSPGMLRGQGDRLEECLASGIILDQSAIVLQHAADRLAYLARRHRRRRSPPARDCRQPRQGWSDGAVRGGVRCRQQALDGLRQLLQLHRLVELHAVLQRDIAPGCRSIYRRSE